EKIEKKTIWGKVAEKVTKRPVLFSIPITLLLLLGAWNVTNLEESYDLIESFPEDLSSRVGYERLADSFSPGSLAPGTLLFVSEQELNMEDLQTVIGTVEEKSGIESVTAQGNTLSKDEKSAKFSVTFKGNPYGAEAFDTVQALRDEGQEILKAAGIIDTDLYIAGESAKNADLRDINNRDTWLVMISMTILITLMLGLQTKSIIAPI
ncbi:MMPL family transporter, partial [Microvirga sp. 3-52]|nr:MMPL family transporter [Microvirga sp. 3-52]